ncbi:pilus assembly protein PilM [Candidatus Nitrotoga sp. M5]|uniref:pilus assembly protein PilM n=1 Tax=Candidatus Nitrotoga sp. M5 TaxID=2890409 RepID=UPI001EF25F84|nr:pilus assembly protein PilM [Candidatus Nitrotoga sp. M5]CAH1385590.1 Type IV pilus inner membrane component PilM [Candidatus Nitrotoga sp. M5]
MIKDKLNIPLDFLYTKTPSLIGVDICSSSIKIVELSESTKKNSYVLERYAIEPLPINAVSDGNVNDMEAASECMRRAWKRMGTRIKKISLALPAAAVISKKIFLPSGLNEKDMEHQVEAEANQYIPFAIDEVNLDFQVLGPAPSNSAEVEILLAASRNVNVEDRVAVAEVAGLKVVVMDVEHYAAEMAFEQIRMQLPGGALDQCVALVDIGAHVMNVNILHNGQSVYMRDQQMGGEQLTQHIQSTFGLSTEEAETGKINGGLPENYESDVLIPFRESLADEVYRAMQLFFTSTQFNEISYIVLAGGSAALPNLGDAVATRTQVKTLIANPFAQMTLSERIKKRQLQIDAPALMIACGLAMRRFDPS